MLLYCTTGWFLQLHVCGAYIAFKNCYYYSYALFQIKLSLYVKNVLIIKTINKWGGVFIMLICYFSIHFQLITFFVYIIMISKAIDTYPYFFYYDYDCEPSSKLTVLTHLFSFRLNFQPYRRNLLYSRVAPFQFRGYCVWGAPHWPTLDHVGQ